MVQAGKALDAHTVTVHPHTVSMSVHYSASFIDEETETPGC